MRMGQELALNYKIGDNMNGKIQIDLEKGELVATNENGIRIFKTTLNQHFKGFGIDDLKALAFKWASDLGIKTISIGEIKENGICENCRYCDRIKGHGDAPRLQGACFCGYWEKFIPENVASSPNNCKGFEHYSDNFKCKVCAVCEKEKAGKCSDFLCRNCATCLFKFDGKCRLFKDCDNCPIDKDGDKYCDFNYTCYLECDSKYWDIYYLKQFNEMNIKGDD